MSYCLNAITLSNLKDRWQIAIQAQKDYTESIHKAHIQNITLAKNVKVGGEYLTNIVLSQDTLIQCRITRRNKSKNWRVFYH